LELFMAIPTLCLPAADASAPSSPQPHGDRAMLALDLGSTTGWAMRLADGVVVSGTMEFRPGRYEGGGMRFLRFRSWLDHLNDGAKGIGTVYFEEVRRHASGIPLTVRYEKDVPRFLAEKSYRPEYGARELRRTVETDVEGALSDLLIEGRVHEGDEVRVKVARDRLHLSCFGIYPQ